MDMQSVGVQEETREWMEAVVENWRPVAEELSPARQGYG